MKNNIVSFVAGIVLALITVHLMNNNCSRNWYLDFNDSVRIGRACVQRNYGCLDNSDSFAICKGYLKADKAAHRHKKPHWNGTATSLNADSQKTNIAENNNKNQIAGAPTVFKIYDGITPGSNPGNTYTVSCTSGNKTQTSTFTFQYTMDQWTSTVTGLPVPYSQVIGSDAITTLLSNYENDPAGPGDPDYFYFDAATLLNFIAFNNNVGGTNVIQDVVFELGRDATNQNRLTLIISGLTASNTLIPINGSQTNALEDAYPCPTCTY